MKINRLKVFTLSITLMLTLFLVACDGTNVASTSDDSTQASMQTNQSDVQVLASPTEHAEGTYEGETDKSGKRNGWGVWIYDNYRYEGYFVNDMPNGEGTLYEAAGGTASNEAALVVIKGNWIDGYADGTILYHWIMGDGDTLSWGVTVSKGHTPSEIKTYDIMNNRSDLTVRPESFFAVPPWSGEETNPSIPAPTGGNAKLPSLPDDLKQFQDKDTQVTDMPAGIPSNNGDAEYFKPVTADYIYYNDGARIYLTSYDESGKLVQFVAKWVYENSADVSSEGYMDEYSGVALSQGIIVDNVIFIDYVTLNDGQLEDRLAYYAMPKVKSDLTSIPASVQANYYVSKP